MKIGFYAPFKPLGHAHPSGDLAIAAGLTEYLTGRGHEVTAASDLRARWIYWQPWRWPNIAAAYRRASRRLLPEPPDLWLSYHTYYKAPDLLGPLAARRLGIPYIIFQGIYSTKRRKALRTWPGFVLNRHALRAAQYVFTNRLEDRTNLERLLPARRVGYVRPGIQTEQFQFDEAARADMRRKWHVEDAPVVVSAAMFRPGIKTQGLEWTIQTCGRLLGKGMSLYLMIAGDGKEKKQLQDLGERCLSGRVRFVGKVPREQMHRFYSAGDVFVFPGIRESLGMVYLEAQACGLPVVAFENGGIPEVVKNGVTGFLTAKFAETPFQIAVESLLERESLRREMGDAARSYVLENHHQEKNYRILEETLKRVVCRHHR